MKRVTEIKGFRDNWFERAYLNLRPVGSMSKKELNFYRAGMVNALNALVAEFEPEAKERSSEIARLQLCIELMKNKAKTMDAE